MIHPISHLISEGLRKENEAHASAVANDSVAALKERFPTVASYVGAFLATVEGKQFAHSLRHVPSGQRILDIGAGYGRSTIYLASRGYRVAAVEPAGALCAVIDQLAAFYGLDVNIYHATAEAIDQVPEKDFDVCVFSASLHHCDDPIHALTNCRGILVPGGTLLVLNEPQLQIFRSKRWFQRQLDKGALVTGDYGGNEHVYYYHEYQAMLRQAGFVRIRDAVSNRYREPASYLNGLRYQGNKGKTILARQLYYRLIRTLQRSSLPGRGVLSLLKRLSLVQTYFVASK